MDSQNSPPNANPSWPIVGALPGMLNDLSGFIKDNRAAHGDMYNIQIFGQNFLMLNHPRHVEHVKIRAKDSYHTGKGSPLLSLLFPDGILTTDGQRWRERRAPIQPFFNQAHLNTKLAVMDASIQRGLAPLEKAVDRQEDCDLKEATSYLSMRVLIETIFGVEAQPEEMVQVRSALEFIITKTMRFIAQANAPDWIPMPGRKESQQAVDTFRVIAQRLIERQRELNIEDDSLFTKLQGMDLHAHKQGYDQLTSQILELLLAGYETTSATMFWVITHLVGHDEILQRVIQEIEATVGEKAPTQDDLKNMPYLKMVISESLRLFPTAYLFWMRCMEDDQIDGYPVVEGDRVVIDAYHVHRHPEFWDDPETFRPERFTAENSRQRPKGAYIPFGLGARKCLGNLFALVEIQLSIVRILQRYKLSFSSGYGIPDSNLGISIRATNDVLLSVARRN